MVSDYSRVNELFQAALERPPEQRDAFLEEACGDDRDLRRDVESLLAANEQAADFLEEPAPVVAGLVAPAAPSLVGREVGPYRVEREVGRGGMGVVYLAEDTRLGRKTALKVLHPDLTADTHRRERLRREARAAAALSHPGVATVYALEEIDGQLMIAREFVEGQTLRATLGPDGLPAADLLDVAFQMALALQAAHARGVVHRDLKPENVIRGTDGVIKLVDFGIAWLDTPDSGVARRLTDIGFVMGTPAYMSPEQIQGGEIDFRTDLFTFGVVVYELACGSNPFEATTPLATAARVASAEPRPLAERNPDVPAGLDRVVRRCLAKRPEERYASAGALVADLVEVRRAVGIQTPGQQAALMPAATSSPSAIPAPAAARNEAERARFWWRVHQWAVIAVYAATAVPIYLARTWVGGRWALSLMLAYVVFAVVNGVLRVHLLFVARVHEAALAGQLRRSQPWVTRADWAVSATMLVTAATVATTQAATSAVLAAVAVGTLAASLIVEPATARAAYPVRGRGPTRRTPATGTERRTPR